MIWHPRDLHLRTGHIEIGGYDEQSVTPGWQNLFSNRSFTKQRLVETDVLASLQTKRAGGICLWIEIDNQNPLARLRQRGTEIHGRSRFSDTALLISSRDDFHETRPSDNRHDDVAACGKRKLNFSNFRFGVSAVAV